MRALFLVLALLVVAACGEVAEPKVEVTQPGVQAFIRVSDQRITGGMVVVDSAAIPADGFVVIHEDDDGKPGAMLGMKALKPGTNNNLIISIVPDGDYDAIAALYFNIGEASFNPEEDVIVTIDDVPVQVPFAIQTEGSEAPDRITGAELAEHDSDDDCWVAYQGAVYDITDFLSKHNQGRLNDLCGTAEDFELAFTRQHSTSKVEVLDAEGIHLGLLE